MYYLQESDSIAPPSHELNRELFQILEEARRRISALMANPEAPANELKQWKRTAEEARAKLILANQGLVASIARGYANYANHGLDIEDLISEGNIGLIKAIEKFDFRRDYRLSTYAYDWIFQAISRSPLMQFMVRVPEGHRAAIRKVKAVQERLRDELGREPLIGDIARKTNLPERKVRALLSWSHQFISFDAPLGDEDGPTYGDVLIDPSVHHPSEAADRADQLKWIQEAAETLSELEREVFNLHLHDRLSLREIGENHGRSGERMRQIYNTALEKVRSYVKRNVREIPVQAPVAVVTKHAETPSAQPAAKAAKTVVPPVVPGKGFHIRMRAVGKNPNHHIWNNNGTWYCDFTLVTSTGGKRRMRDPLYAVTVEEARTRRDQLILLYNGSSGASAG